MSAEIVGDALFFPPVYPADYRKDLMITLVDRAGAAVKSWVILDAWPCSFKPGNDLDANASEKLITEIGICFEAWVEISGESIRALTDESDKAARKASVAAALGFIVNGGNAGGGIFG